CLLSLYLLVSTFFSFIATPTTQIYTLSLHDALPIYRPEQPLGTVALDTRVRHRLRVAFLRRGEHRFALVTVDDAVFALLLTLGLDRKSTRLNSSHRTISYAVFCLKKKKNRKYINNY